MNPKRTSTPAMAVCLHCGTEFRPSDRLRPFCCSGCQFVHDLITKNGYGQFYDLQEGGVQPVKSLVFQKRDYTWLEQAARVAESAGQPSAALQLDLQGVSCIGCAWLIEKVFAQRPGALALHVDPVLGEIDLRWTPGVFDVLAFARLLQAFGYLVGPRAAGDRPASRGLIIRLGLCSALAMNTMLFTLPSYLGMETGAEFAVLFARITLILGTLSLLIGGSYFFTRSWRSLRQGVAVGQAGDLGELFDRLDRPDDDPAITPAGPEWISVLALTRGLCLLADGDVAAARQRFDACTKGGANQAPIAAGLLAWMTTAGKHGVAQSLAELAAPKATTKPLVPEF